MFKLLLLTSRPLFWLTHISSFLFGIALLDFNTLDWRYFLLAILLLCFPFSMFIYGLNDISDYESDLTNNRKGGILGLQHKHKDLRIILGTSLIAGLVFLIVSSYFGFVSLLMSACLLLILGFYSLKPLRFKNIIVIDAITGGGLYSLLIALWGYSLFTKGLPTESISLNPFIFMFVIGFILQSIGSIIDYHSDIEHNERTSSTVLGRQTVAIYTSILTLTGIYLITNNFVMKFVLCLFAIFSFSFVFKKVNEDLFIKKYFSVIGIVLSFIISVICYFYYPSVLR